MINKLNISCIKVIMLLFLVVLNLQSWAQNEPADLFTEGHLNFSIYHQYENKTRKLLSDLNIDPEDVLFESLNVEKGNYKAFKAFLVSEFFDDERKFIIEVGQGKIDSQSDIIKYIGALKRKYQVLYVNFKKIQQTFNEDSKLSVSKTPFSPGRAAGQPCQNMDFESQNLSSWVGSYGSSDCDPIAITGFNNTGNNSGTGQHTIMTGGNDPNVAAIPCVMPGGTASLRLGDNGGGGNRAARISQTFLVEATNPYFTYNYAVILEDASHTLSEQPYFQIRMYDGSNNLISCATLDVDATNAPGLIDIGGIKYKNWTQVVIPLNSYVGQDVRIEFTTADCNNGAPSGGSHDGYAYIDCSCVPPQIFTSSPTICGGTTINVTAPSGLSSYSWTGPGIVGSNTGQTIVVDQSGTYTVTMETNTTAPNTPCIFSLDTIIPSNPSSPVAQFISDIVCQGTATQFTDQSTPVGSINGWAWDFDNNGSVDATIQNPTHTFPAAGTYPVSLTVNWGTCTDNIITNVTVTSGTSPAINPSGPFCSNNSPVTLTATIAGGTWSGPGISNATTGIFDPSLAAIGNNTITYTTSGSCGGTVNSVIIINPLPIAEAGPPVIICSGTAATIGVASTAGYTYSWLPATGLSASNISNPSITTVNSGTTPLVSTYTLTVTNNGCSAKDSTVVTVNPQPVLTITNPGPVCSSTVNITASSITTGSTGGGVLSYWSNAAATTALSSPSAITTSGTYYIKVTATGGCTDIKPVTVTINPGPVSNAGPDVTICSGTAATIGVASTAGYTYSWLPATGLSASNISNPSITTVNSGTTPLVSTYTLTVTTNNGCPAKDSTVVTVNPQPVLTITDPAPVCSPNTVDITASSVTTGSTGGGTFSYWSDAAATTALFTPSAIATSGPYYIKVTATGGCTDIKPVTVTVNPVPVSNAGPDLTLCSGIAGSIGVATTAGYTYSWAPATGLSSATVSDPANTTINNGTTPIVTNYTLTTTISSTGCQSTDQAQITVNPQPVLTIIDPAPVCSPNTVDITASSVTTGSTGGGTFSYWSDAAATTALSTPSAIATSGTYYIKVTATGGCTDIAPVNVTIKPVPVSDAGNPVAICSGTPATIGTANNTAYTYSWSPATGLSSSTVSDPGITATASGASPLITTYTVTTTENGCSSTDEVQVTVNPLPVLATTDPTPVCTPNLVDITASAVTAGSTGGGTLTYWPTAAATGTPLASPSAINASGIYYIKTTTAAGCTDVDSVVVVINPLPVSNAGPDVTICTGSSSPIGAASVTGYTYQWNPVTGLNDVTSSNPAVSLSLPNSATQPVNNTYAVITTNTATGCQSSDTVIVTVNPVATANAGSTQYVCTGASVTLAGAVGGSATGGIWSGGTGTYSPNNTTLNAVYTPSAAEYAADSVILTLTTNDPAGPCTYASSSVTLHFYPKPVVNFSVDDPSGCPIHCVIFTDLSTIASGSIVNLAWNFGDGNTDNTNNPSPAHCYPLTGFYDVMLTVTSDHNCTSDSTQVHMIEVYAKPTAEFTPSPNPASVLEPTVTLNNGSSSDVNYWSYQFGDGDSISPYTPSPVHVYPNAEPETYTATLIVHNANDCWDTVQHDVVIGPEFTFYIPNAFTPNDDGVNDYFFGQGIGIEKYDIYIFDRWGNMIYHGDNIYASKWDGRANKGADPAQQDVYVWKVKLTDVFKKVHTYMGTVTIVR